MALVPRLLLLFLTTIFIGTNGQKNDHLNSTFSLIVGYLHKYKIPIVYVFSCWSKKDNAKLLNLIFSTTKTKVVLTKSKAHLISRQDNKRVTYHGFILDMKCEQFEDLLNGTNRFNFRLTRPWLILTSDPDENYWENYFRDIKLRLDSNMKLAAQNADSSEFRLIDIYNSGYGKGGRTIVQQIGSWDGSVWKDNHLSLYETRKGMSTITLRAVSVILNKNHSGSFEEYMFDTRTKSDIQSKFIYHLFLLAQHVHGFKFNVTIFEIWFGTYKNGSNAGVGKAIYEQTADISCTGASPRLYRVEIYDYVMPCYNFRPSLLYRNPGNVKLISDQFLQPFSANAWIVTLMMSILFCLLLKLAYRVEHSRYSWATTVLITSATLFQQGIDLFPRGKSGRVVFLTLLFTSVLLYNYYTSSILSSLLKPPPDSFKNLEELAHSTLEVAIENLPFIITYFQVQNFSDVQYLYHHKIFPPGAHDFNIYPREAGIAKIKQGGFAYHAYLDTSYPIIARTFDQEQICDLKEMPIIPRALSGFLVQKKSELLELLQITMRKTKEAGFVNRLSLIWEGRKPECLSNVIIVPLGIAPTFVAFFCLFLGVAFGLSFLVIEIVCVKARKIRLHHS